MDTQSDIDWCCPVNLGIYSPEEVSDTSFRNVFRHSTLTVATTILIHLKHVAFDTGSNGKLTGLLYTSCAAQPIGIIPRAVPVFAAAAAPRPCARLQTAASTARCLFLSICGTLPSNHCQPVFLERLLLTCLIIAKTRGDCCSFFCLNYRENTRSCVFFHTVCARDGGVSLVVGTSCLFITGGSLHFDAVFIVDYDSNLTAGCHYMSPNTK